MEIRFCTEPPFWISRGPKEKRVACSIGSNDAVAMPLSTQRCSTKNAQHSCNQAPPAPSISKTLDTCEMLIMSKIELGVVSRKNSSFEADEHFWTGQGTGKSTVPILSGFMHAACCFKAPQIDSQSPRETADFARSTRKLKLIVDLASMLVDVLWRVQTDVLECAGKHLPFSFCWVSAGSYSLKA